MTDDPHSETGGTLWCQDPFRCFVEGIEFLKPSPDRDGESRGGDPSLLPPARSPQASWCAGLNINWKIKGHDLLRDLRRRAPCSGTTARRRWRRRFRLRRGECISRVSVPPLSRAPSHSLRASDHGERTLSNPKSTLWNSVPPCSKCSM